MEKIIIKNKLEQYQQIFIKVFNVEADKLGKDFTSCNVENWNSVTQLALATAFGDSFDVMLDAEDIFKLTSYDNGIEVLRKYGVDI